MPLTLGRRTLLLSTLAPTGAVVAAGCTATTSSPVPAGESAMSLSPAPTGRPLLVFFSRAGENYHYGDRRDLEVGNTAILAGMIAELTDVDVHEIQAADPYPEDYEATVERNTREQEADARPAIAGSLPAWQDYDTVLIGSPVWNVRAPMIMRTVVDSFDFIGKTVLPFVTHAVSGMGRVADEYTEICVGATVGDGLAVQGEEVAQARAEVETWLAEVGLLANT